ncbi:uncharacterized protein BKA78DRAFT_31284 [Phyllosticta capitalensis]|uniref:uncharacterized protein n=1 Tax=Phyllosticta capitalensis TaxID=121624 RepID=UPI003130B5C2
MGVGRQHCAREEHDHRHSSFDLLGSTPNSSTVASDRMKPMKLLCRIRLRSLRFKETKQSALKDGGVGSTVGIEKERKTAQSVPSRNFSQRHHPNRAQSSSYLSSQQNQLACSGRGLPRRCRHQCRLHLCRSTASRINRDRSSLADWKFQYKQHTIPAGHR